MRAAGGWRAGIELPASDAHQHGALRPNTRTRDHTTARGTLATARFHASRACRACRAWAHTLALLPARLGRARAREPAQPLSSTSARPAPRAERLRSTHVSSWLPRRSRHQPSRQPSKLLIVRARGTFRPGRSSSLITIDGLVRRERPPRTIFMRSTTTLLAFVLDHLAQPSDRHLSLIHI